MFHCIYFFPAKLVQTLIHPIGHQSDQNTILPKFLLAKQWVYLSYLQNTGKGSITETCLTAPAKQLDYYKVSPYCGSLMGDTPWSPALNSLSTSHGRWCLLRSHAAGECHEEEIAGIPRCESYDAPSPLKYQ